MTLLRKIGIIFITLLFAGVLFIYFATKNTTGVLILEYHRINNQTNDEYTVPIDEFQEQIDYLKGQGYTTISLMDFIRAKKYGEPLPSKPVILTFDDGYEDIYTNVMPILTQNNMKATVFVVTNYIGHKNYLTWQQLKQMQENNIELGSHTANHLLLATLTPDKINDEIHLSKLLMEWSGLSTVYFFSYPMGNYNTTAHNILEQDNYLGAVTGDPGLNNFTTDPYLLHRTYIPRSKLGILNFKLRLLKSKLYSYFKVRQN